MTATGAPGTQAWAARLRGARSPRPGPGWAQVARPHSPESGSDWGCSSSVAAVRDTQPGPGCADRAGNSAAAAAAVAAAAWPARPPRGLLCPATTAPSAGLGSPSPARAAWLRRPPPGRRPWVRASWASDGERGREGRGGREGRETETGDRETEARQRKQKRWRTQRREAESEETERRDRDKLGKQTKRI